MTGALIVEIEGDSKKDWQQPGEAKEAVKVVLVKEDGGGCCGADGQATNRGNRGQGAEGDPKEGVQLEGEEFADKDRKVDGRLDEGLVGHDWH